MVWTDLRQIPITIEVEWNGTLQIDQSTVGNERNSTKYKRIGGLEDWH